MTSRDGSVGGSSGGQRLSVTVFESPPKKPRAAIPPPRANGTTLSHSCPACNPRLLCGLLIDIILLLINDANSVVKPLNLL